MAEEMLEMKESTPLNLNESAPLILQGSTILEMNKAIKSPHHDYIALLLACFTSSLTLSELIPHASLFMKHKLAFANTSDCELSLQSALNWSNDATLTIMLGKIVETWDLCTGETERWLLYYSYRDCETVECLVVIPNPLSPASEKSYLGMSLSYENDGAWHYHDIQALDLLDFVRLPNSLEKALSICSYDYENIEDTCSVAPATQSEQNENDYWDLYKSAPFLPSTGLISTHQCHAHSTSIKTDKVISSNGNDDNYWSKYEQTNLGLDTTSEQEESSSLTPSANSITYPNQYTDHENYITSVSNNKRECELESLRALRQLFIQAQAMGISAKEFVLLARQACQEEI